MNERIRELAKQAESYANSKIHMTGWNYREEYNKKFAELIVQECASVCENSNYQFGKIFTKMIKENFGVEK